MLAYLGHHGSYWPMSSWNGGFVLSWNIKVYRADYSGKCNQKEFPTNDRFDDQWDSYCQTNHDLFNWACEDGTRYYTEGDWTNYPGIEQGEWKFGINGRSGGHMILSDCPGWLPAPQGWTCCKMTWDSRADYQEWLNNLETPTLRQFYRAIRVLDRDLNDQACEREISYQYAFRRHEWEADLIADEECSARKQEAARPHTGRDAR